MKCVSPTAVPHHSGAVSSGAVEMGRKCGQLLRVKCGIVGAVAVSWGRAGKQVGWCHMCHPHPLLAVRPEKIQNKNTNNKSATFVIHPSLSVHERKLNIVIYYIFSFEWPAACWYNLWNLFNKWYNICERHDTNMWRTIDLKKNFIHYEIKLIGRSSPDE